MIGRRGFVAGASAAFVAGIAPRRAWGRTEADVVIVGAGLSGLYCAMLLADAGLRPVVVEAQRRVGGRLKTLDAIPGRPEAGGLQIGALYGRVMTAANWSETVLDDPAPPQGAPGFAYHVGGSLMAAADWPASPANRLASIERATLPSALVQTFLRSQPPLADEAAWAEPAAASRDVSLGESMRAAGMSGEALRLAGCNFNGGTLNAMSLLHMLRAAAIFAAGAGPTKVVRGGTQRLAERMAAQLPDVRTGKPVTAIAADGSSATVTFADGSSLAARHAVVTLPFSVLRNIALDAPLAPTQAEAITTMPYTPVTQVHVVARTPFWRADGLPKYVWSDGRMGRVIDYGGSHDGVHNLVFWLNGDNAAWADARPAGAAAAELIAALEAARPAARGQLEWSPDGFVSWQSDPFARGAYHHWAPAQMTRLGTAGFAPAGRLHFAGEHLALRSSGMEAACESGERAALAILGS
jgi:monoamine oxidase